MKPKSIIDVERIKDELGDEIEGLVGRQEFEAFKEFAFKDRMIQMAIAFMLGAAFKNVVSSISEHLIMPFLTYIMNQTDGDWRQVVFEPVEGIVIELGNFLGVFVDFIIIAAILYYLYSRIFKKIESDNKPPEIDCEEGMECPFCLCKIHYQSARCPYCTAILDNPFAKNKINEEQRSENQGTENNRGDP